VERIADLRSELNPMCGEGTVIGRRGMTLEWWTFAGLAANQTVVQYLQPHITSQCRADNLWIRLPNDLSLERLNEVIAELQSENAAPSWDLGEPAKDLLKFSDLLPGDMLNEMILSRIADVPRANAVLRSPIRIVDC
jgi:ATP-dependent Lhr-like helicase